MKPRLASQNSVQHKRLTESGGDMKHRKESGLQHACSACRYSAFCLSTSVGFAVLFDACALQFAARWMEIAGLVYDEVALTGSARQVVQTVQKLLPSACPRMQPGTYINVTLGTELYDRHMMRCVVP